MHSNRRHQSLKKCLVILLHFISCRHVQHCQSINSHTFPLQMRAETLCWWLLAYLVLEAPECFQNSSVPLWSNLWVMRHVKSDLPLVRTCPHPKVKRVDSHEIPPFKMQQNVSWDLGTQWYSTRYINWACFYHPVIHQPEIIVTWGCSGFLSRNGPSVLPTAKWYHSSTKQITIRLLS